MGLEFTPDAHDYFFLRLFELGGEKDVQLFDYKKILEEWGKDEDRSKIILLFKENKKYEKKPQSIDMKPS